MFKKFFGKEELEDILSVFHKTYDRLEKFVADTRAEIVDLEAQIFAASEKASVKTDEIGRALLVKEKIKDFIN